ncbi:hypothetical protein Osc1_23920 [Hominimerdicola sp. 21CYCFAH17_S]
MSFVSCDFLESIYVAKYVTMPVIKRGKILFKKYSIALMLSLSDVIINIYDIVIDTGIIIKAFLFMIYLYSNILLPILSNQFKSCHA